MRYGQHVLDCKPLQIGLAAGGGTLLCIITVAIIWMKYHSKQKHATTSDAVPEQRYHHMADINDTDSLSGIYPNRMTSEETGRYPNRITTKETEMHLYSKETYLDVLHSMSNKVIYVINPCAKTK